MDTIKLNKCLENNAHQVHITKTASKFVEYSHTVTVLHDQRNIRRKLHHCNANIYIYIYIYFTQELS